MENVNFHGKNDTVAKIEENFEIFSRLRKNVYSCFQKMRTNSIFIGRRNMEKQTNYNLMMLLESKCIYGTVSRVVNWYIPIVKPSNASKSVRMIERLVLPGPVNAVATCLASKKNDQTVGGHYSRDVSNMLILLH